MSSSAVIRAEVSGSPSGDRLLIIERAGRAWQLRLIETATFTEVARTQLATRPGSDVSWRADGAAFVNSGSAAVTAFSSDGGPLWTIERSGFALGWSADGRWFALLGTGHSGRHDVIVADGQTEHALDLSEHHDGSLVLRSGYPWLHEGTIVVRDALSGESSARLKTSKSCSSAMTYRRLVARLPIWRASSSRRSSPPSDCTAGAGGLHWVSIGLEHVVGQQ